VPKLFLYLTDGRSKRMGEKMHCNYTVPETLLGRQNYGEWDGQCSMHAW